MIQSAPASFSSSRPRKPHSTPHTVSPPFFPVSTSTSLSPTKRVVSLVFRFTPCGLGEEELAQALAEFSAYYGAHKEDKTAPYLVDGVQQGAVQIENNMSKHT